MNANIQQKIQDLVDALRTESDHNATAFRLFVNCESHIHEVETLTKAKPMNEPTASENAGDGSPLPSTPGSQPGIQWDGDVGVEDFCDICTKRRTWWVKLEDGQAAQVADLRRPVLKYETEHRAYAEAIYRAGQWAGEMVSFANIERSREG